MKKGVAPLRANLEDCSPQNFQPFAARIFNFKRKIPQFRTLLIHNQPIVCYAMFARRTPVK
jgi:hypothetical protein